MPLTVNDIAKNLRYGPDLDAEEFQELQDLLDEAIDLVRTHIKDKYDPENKTQQRAIKGICGFYDLYRNGEKDMPPTFNGLPDFVYRMLMPFYIPLAM